jgi:hypothetical protein
MIFPAQFSYRTTSMGLFTAAQGISVQVIVLQPLFVPKRQDQTGQACIPCIAFLVLLLSLLLCAVKQTSI